MKYLSMLLLFAVALACIQSPCPAIAQDAAAQEEKAEKKEGDDKDKKDKEPKTIKLKTKDLAIYKTVDGVVESTRVTEVETDFEQWSNLVILSLIHI